jgi:hypothetical protein
MHADTWNKYLESLMLEGEGDPNCNDVADREGLQFTATPPQPGMMPVPECFVVLVGQEWDAGLRVVSDGNEIASVVT